MCHTDTVICEIWKKPGEKCLKWSREDLNLNQTEVAVRSKLLLHLNSLDKLGSVHYLLAVLLLCISLLSVFLPEGHIAKSFSFNKKAKGLWIMSQNCSLILFCWAKQIIKPGEQFLATQALLSSFFLLKSSFFVTTNLVNVQVATF